MISLSTHTKNTRITKAKDQQTKGEKDDKQDDPQENYNWRSLLSIQGESNMPASSAQHSHTTIGLRIWKYFIIISNNIVSRIILGCCIINYDNVWSWRRGRSRLDWSHWHLLISIRIHLRHSIGIPQTASLPN